MNHKTTRDDLSFRQAFENQALSAGDFGHEAHLRIAYVYLCEFDRPVAAQRMKDGLIRFLAHLGAAPDKYHETLTRAWIDAVAHFMDRSAGCKSFAVFIERHPALLDSNIMLTHYSGERLFSEQARRDYLAPDIEATLNARD